jgi:hypothetical protein
MDNQLRKKTKYIRVSKKTHNQCKQIATGGYTFEIVSSSPYLSSIINDDDSISEEITHRTKKGNKAYNGS